MKIRTEAKYVIRRTIVVGVITAAIVGVISHNNKSVQTINVNTVQVNTTQVSTTKANTVVTAVLKTETVKVEQKSVQAINPTDLETLARLIQSEADGESFSGKLAVGTVVMNRVDSGRWGKTIKSVVSAKYQFSGYNNKLYKAALKEDNVKAAKQILSGYRSFDDKNIVFYFNDKIATDKAFMKTVKVVTVIGNHKFGTERGK